MVAGWLSELCPPQINEQSDLLDLVTVDDTYVVSVANVSSADFSNTTT